MYSIGIDLGGTNIAVGLCDENLTIIDREKTKTMPERSPELIIADMAALVKALIERNNIPLDEIRQIGIATPGNVNRSRGIIEDAYNLPFKDFPIVEEFKKHLNVERVNVENDANAAALGETLAGSAKGVKNAIMVTLGTGVGGGIILDGKIFSGSVNTAGGELGHMVIVAGGRQCTCGRRGCFEAYASATGLIAATKEKMNELSIKGIPSLLFEEAEIAGKVTARTAFEAAKRGDEYGKKLVEDYIFYLSVGITNIINIFQPEIISIGGGVSGEGDYLLKPLWSIVEKEQYTRRNANKTKLVTATLGNNAGIVGAAGLEF